LQAGVNGFIRKEDAALELLKAIPVVMAGQSYLSPSAVTAVSRALQPGSHPVAALPTGREREVLSALAEGLTYKEIASRLKIAARTVTTYRERLAQKTGCKTRAELVRYAVRHGIARA